jgi:hypothetical protein
LEARVAPIIQPAGQIPFYSIDQSKVTADGRSRYRVTFSGAGSLAVLFFDLANGTVQPSLALPFSGSPGDPPPFEQSVSHDGRQLYVLAPTLGQLAIVDLTTRRLERIVSLGNAVPGTPTASDARSPLARLWDGLRGLVVEEAAAKTGLLPDMQVSPDGRWLYAIDIAGQGEAAHTAGILVIDTATWTIIKHWQSEQEPGALSLGADGRYLYVQLLPAAGQDGSIVRVLDTATGQTVFETPLSIWQLNSLADLYREDYGRSPTESRTTSTSR